MNAKLLKKLRNRYVIIKNRKKTSVWYTIYDSDNQQDISIDYDTFDESMVAYRKYLLSSLDKYMGYNRKPIYPKEKINDSKFMKKFNLNFLR